MTITKERGHDFHLIAGKEMHIDGTDIVIWRNIHYCTVASI